MSRLSNKNMVYNNIINVLLEKEYIELNNTVETNMGKVKGLISNKVFHYVIVDLGGNKSKRYNLRLLNTQSLETIELAIKNNI